MVFISKGVFTSNAFRKYGPFAIPLAAYMFGKYVSFRLDENARSYHNRSALYGGRNLQPGERIW